MKSILIAQLNIENKQEEVTLKIEKIEKNEILLNIVSLLLVVIIVICDFYEIY